MTKRKGADKEIPSERNLIYDEAGRLHFSESYGLRSRRATPDSYVDLFHEKQIHNKALEIIVFSKVLFQEFQAAHHEGFREFRAEYGERPWSAYIETKKGALSLEATSAVFHELIQDISLGFLASNEIDLASHKSDSRYIDFREKIFRLCDAWHWLHLELFNEHRKALRGDQAETIRQKGAEGNAVRGKLKKSIVEEQVRLACRDLKGKLSARRMADILRSKIESHFNKESLTPYTEEVLIKTIREALLKISGDGDLEGQPLSGPSDGGADARLEEQAPGGPAGIERRE
jgi:hypothetical protein